MNRTDTHREMRPNALPRRIREMRKDSATLGGGGLDSQVGSVVGQSAERPGFDSRRRKGVGHHYGIGKYLAVSVSSYVEVCMC